MNHLKEIILAENSSEDGVLITQFFIKYQLLEKLIQTGYEGAFDFISARKKEAPVKLVIVDLSDAGKQKGIELIRKIRIDNALKSISVVVLINSQENNEIIELHRLSINASIVKPINLVKFKRIVSYAGILHEYFTRFPDTNQGVNK